MAVQGFSSQKCKQRSRVAAARFGVEAAPLGFRGSVPSVLKNDGFTVMRSVGTLPDTPDDVLALINAKRPEGASELAKGDVFVHFLEAANSNFVDDRSLYLGDSTLQNIAVGGEARVAFMNAHRTGGLSSPSELPFGQTFCGCYEEGFDADGRAAMRSLLGVFMLRGVKPNGEQGPSTDDLDAGMRAGTIADVSVGLNGGDAVCGVCGNGLNARDSEGRMLCPHYPGTHEAMTSEQIESQKQRDPFNERGVATYTLHNATLGEVSAVYDGAVPGAGVRKVMQFARSADTTRADVQALLREAFDFYGPLLPFDLGDVVELKGDSNPNKEFHMDDEELEDPQTEPDEVPDDDDSEDEPEPEAAPDPSLVDDDDTEEDEALASAPLDATPENIARLQARLAGQSQRLSSVRDSERAARAISLQNARDNFATSMKAKVPPTTRPFFNVLYAALQNGTATTTHLETALAQMPRNPMFEPVEADLTVVEPRRTPSQVSNDEEEAKNYAKRRNSRNGRKPAKGATT